MVPGAAVLHVAAGLGIDESTREELVEPGSANLKQENTRHADRMALACRLGFDALTTTRLDSTSRSVGKKLFAHADQICAADKHLLDAYSPQLTRWVTRGRLPEPVHQRFPIPFTTSAWDDCALVLAGNCIVVAASFPVSTTWTIVATILDSTTLTVLRTDVIATGAADLGVDMAVVESDSTVILAYHSTGATVSGHSISCASAAAVNAGWSAAVSLFTDGGTSVGDGFRFDMQSLTNRVAIAYRNNSGGTDRVTVRTYDSAMAGLETRTVNTASNNPISVTVDGSIADTLWVSWNEGANVRVIGLDADALAVTLATTATCIVGSGVSQPKAMGVVVTGTGTGKVFAHEAGSSGTSPGYCYTREFSTSGGAVLAGAAQTPFYHVAQVSKPVRVDGRDYVTAFRDGGSAGAEDTRYLLDLTEAQGSGNDRTSRLVGTVAPRITPAVTHRQRPIQLTSTKYVYMIRTRRNQVANGSELVIFDFANTSLWSTASTIGSTILSASCTYEYDGETPHEVNFPHRPPPPVVTAGGAGVVPATVNYCAIYEWVDASGNAHWSGTSDPTGPITTGGNQQVVNIGTIAFSQKHTANHKIRVVIYRSDSNGLFKRLTELDNVPASDTVTYTDNTSTVSGNAELYRQPGVNGTNRSRETPPGFLHVCSFNDFIVGVGDDGYTLWWSGQRIAGEGTWFADRFQLPITEGGPIVGIVALEGSLFVLKRYSLFVVSGEPSSDNGAQGGLGTPRRLAAEVGCKDVRSIVPTNLGVFFQSDRGLELLTRGLEIVFLGEYVQNTLATYPVVHAATLDTRQGLVRFSVGATEDDTDGRFIIFDLSIQKWVSVDQVRGTGGTTFHGHSAAMVLHSGLRRYAFIDALGNVRLESATAKSDADGTQFITALWETPWLKLELQRDMQFWQAVMLYERQLRSGLLIEPAYDWAAYDLADAKTFSESEVLSYQRQLELRISKARQAVKFRIRATNPGAGDPTGPPEFLGLSIDLAPRQGATHGTPRLATAARK